MSPTSPTYHKNCPVTLAFSSRGPQLQLLRYQMDKFTKMLSKYEDQCFNMGLMYFGGKYDYLNFLNNYFLKRSLDITTKLHFTSEQRLTRTMHWALTMAYK